MKRTKSTHKKSPGAIAPGPEDPLRDAERGPRLQKVLAAAGVGSRRACEELIEAGRVSVNGRVVSTLPAWADPNADEITIDGRPIAAAPPRSHTYLLVDKPKRVICTNADPHGRTRILDLVPHGRRLFCVGRLDAASTGLVLLTDDGPLAHRLMHPRYEVPKTYEVSVRGELGGEQIERLRSGLWLADKSGRAAKSRAAGATLLSRDRDSTRLRITLTEGRNREVRRLLARLGFKVKRLRRTALGPLRLKGVGKGQWRRLDRREVAELHRTARRGAKSE